MSPDPDSRSKSHDGRRLALIDPERVWGWRIVNYADYRERARLAAKSAAEVASGRNANRLKARRPPLTAADPLSDRDSDININIEGESGAKAPTPSKKDGLAKKPKKEKRGPLAHFVPKDWEIPDEDAAWALKEFPSLDVYAETQKFRDHEFQSARSDWTKTWRNWIRKAAERPPGVINGRR